METNGSVANAVHPFFVWASQQAAEVGMRVYGYVEVVAAVTQGQLLVEVNGVWFPDYQVGADAAFCLFALSSHAGYSAAARVFHELYQCLADCAAAPLSLSEVLS